MSIDTFLLRRIVKGITHVELEMGGYRDQFRNMDDREACELASDAEVVLAKLATLRSRGERLLKKLC